MEKRRVSAEEMACAEVWGWEQGLQTTQCRRTGVAAVHAGSGAAEEEVLAILGLSLRRPFY